MKKNKLAIVLIGIVVVAVVIIGVLFATGKLSLKHGDSKGSTNQKTTEKVEKTEEKPQEENNNIETSEKEEIKENNTTEEETNNILETLPDVSWKFPTEDGYTIVSNYGEYEVLGIKEWSPGIDISKGEGSNIYAAYDGKVVTKKSEGSYGNYIMIDHNNGYYTLYAHLKDFAPGIEEGTTVTKGQVIGYMGMTGAASGPHLHFEIRTCPEYSCTVDPMTLLK